MKNITSTIENFSDEKLLSLCKKYGTQTILWRRKFIGLLPEVNRRQLFVKKGFASIFEFGKRMAGLSENQIRLAINIEKRFEDKPTLKAVFSEGALSINKLARIVSIANPENEEFLAQSAKVLSNRSLEVFVKDIKLASTLRSQNGLFEPRIDPKSLHVQTSAEAKLRHLGGRDELSEEVERVTVMKFGLSDEVVGKLNELHSKGHDVNEILLEMLEKREVEIEQEKAEIGEIVRAKEEGRKAYMGKPAEHIHHTIPFSLSQSHDPALLRPLCRAHHDIVHSVNSNYLAKKML
ncbi:MAG: HNH endonuclease signature motif containing protein [Candidatus Peregrinibacteria bacterium]|nr:HNH endonuclease signature motif containing protein [Candidatus Peregrinibacteria bacterium]